MKVKKKRKALKITIIVISALVALLVIATIVLLWLSRDYLVWNNSPRPEVAQITVDERAMTGYGEDALYLVRIIEETNPIFIVEGYLPDDYTLIRDEFLELAKNTTSRQEFVFAAYRYVMTLQDGHMAGFNLFGVGGMTGGYLDVEWEVQDSRILLVDEDEVIDIEVIEIGGVPPSQIFAVIDSYVFAENEVYRLWNYGRYARYGTMIEVAGGRISNNQTILTLNENGEIRERAVDLEVLMPPTEPFCMSAFAASFEFVVRHEILEDDIFFIDLQVFYIDDSIEKVAQYIEQAIDDGIRQFIVDLRGNPGGNSMVGYRLFQAMGITMPTNGVVRRFSPLMIDTATQYGLLTPFERGFVSIASALADGMIGVPTTATAANPNDVFVSVLTDNDSYSSATMMAYWAQDGGFGNIIGTPSRNSPTAFGDMLTFTLPYSGLEVRVSHAQFLRPDPRADQTTLWPDILVDPADALDVALEYLRSRTKEEE